MVVPMYERMNERR